MLAAFNRAFSPTILLAVMRNTAVVCVLVFAIVLGFFMDTIEIVLIVVPIAAPVGHRHGCQLGLAGG